MGLVDAGIPTEMVQGKIMHLKMVIVDSRIVGTGSFNWTKNAIHSNYENFVILDSDVIVKSHQKAFDEIWDKFTHCLMKES